MDWHKLLEEIVSDKDKCDLTITILKHLKEITCEGCRDKLEMKNRYHHIDDNFCQSFRVNDLTSNLIKAREKKWPSESEDLSTENKQEKSYVPQKKGRKKATST